MKKVFLLTAALLLAFPFAAFGQEKVAQGKTHAGQIAVDSDEYIIGPEDVLYIHIWKEEAMTKTVPVRMDGKIMQRNRE